MDGLTKPVNITTTCVTPGTQTQDNRYTTVRVLRLIAYSFTLLLHISNIGVITGKKRLHNAFGWLLISLSVSDIMLLIISLYVDGSPQNVDMNIIIVCVFGLGYIASLFSSLGISLEKYIAVQYSLRYHSLVTKKNLAKAIVTLWISSIILSVLPAVIAVVTKEMLYFHSIHFGLRFVCSLLLLACASYIRNIRNMHQRDMDLQRRQGGRQGGSTNHFHRIKSSVSDVIRLNVITAIIVIVVNATAAMFRYGVLQRNPVLHEAMVVANGFYLISNPVIYISVIKDLRNEYRKVFGCRKVTVAPSLDKSVSLTTTFEI